MKIQEKTTQDYKNIILEYYYLRSKHYRSYPARIKIAEDNNISVDLINSILYDKRLESRHNLSEYKSSCRRIFNIDNA